MRNELVVHFNPVMLTAKASSHPLNVKFGGVKVEGVSNYDDLENKPSVNGIELQGGDNTIPVPSKTSDLQNDSGFITEEDIPDIPSKTSDLTNDSGFVNASEASSAAPVQSVNGLRGVVQITLPTALSDLENDEGFITLDDVPPVITDLGYIDAEEYDDDVGAFLNTLTESGFYRFTFSTDDFSYIVNSQSIITGDTLLLNQHYWGDEEGPLSEYVRSAVIEDGEVVEELTTNYMTFDVASIAFAPASHVHYRTASAEMSVWDYCSSNSIVFMTDSPILYKDTRNSGHNWLIETTSAASKPISRFMKVTDLGDASVIYQRAGAYNAGTISWGSWYKFTGAIFTP